MANRKYGRDATAVGEDVFASARSHSAAEYRQNQPDRAIAIVQGEASGVLGPAPKLVLAMSQYKKGLPAEAAETLAAAISSFDWNESQAIDDSTVWIFHILRREAEALILQK